MIHDARSLFQPLYDGSVQDSAALTTAIKQEKIPPAVKMLVGPWYLDEFGNPTREIKALD